MRQDYNILGEGVAEEVLRKDNKLFNKMKGNYTYSLNDPSGNIKYTFTKDGRKFIIGRDQMNLSQIAKEAKEIRELSEKGGFLPCAPLDSTADKPELDKKPWVHIPASIDIEISNLYFGGMPIFEVVLKNRTTKIQYYKVIQRYYPAFITYPGGVLPIPDADKVPFPTKLGETKHFRMQ